MGRPTDVPWTAWDVPWDVAKIFHKSLVSRVNSGGRAGGRAYCRHRQVSTGRNVATPCVSRSSGSRAVVLVEKNLPCRRLLRNEPCCLLRREITFFFANNRAVVVLVEKNLPCRRLRQKEPCCLLRLERTVFVESDRAVVVLVENNRAVVVFPTVGVGLILEYEAAKAKLTPRSSALVDSRRQRQQQQPPSQQNTYQQQHQQQRQRQNRWCFCL